MRTTATRQRTPTPGTTRKATPDRAESAQEDSRWPPALIPGLRDRLLRELDEAGIAPRRRIGKLCRITGRKSPTVRRWLDPDQAGLPDLESFARLCHSLNVDAEYLLGLSDVRRADPAPSTTADASAPWLHEVERAAERLLHGCEAMVMAGDDMEPKIRDGDVLFVDRRVTALAGNGTYVVEYSGRQMVRTVEDRLAEGIALRCANKRYAEVLVPRRALASSKLRIVGKVVARMSITGV